jgi:predicted Zn-dependent protease
MLFASGELAAKDRIKPRDKEPREKTADPAAISFDADLLENFLGGSQEEDRQALAEIEIAPKEEKRLGDAAAEAYLNTLRSRGIRVVRRGAEIDYLRKLVATLQPMLRNADRYRNVWLHLADSPEIDARSFPGGTIVVFRGLIDFAESEAALVGVLGHELSHFDRGHQLVSLKRVKLAQKNFDGRRSFDPKQMLSAGGQMARLFGRPFRPEDEAQADEDGAAWAFRAGYDPREMAKLFLRLDERKPAGDKAPFMPALMRTHPFSLDRHRAIVAQAEKLIADSPDAPLYVGRTNLARRIPRSEREFDP